MKYAIGNRLNFVQIDTQFSYEFNSFLDAYAGINNAKQHKAISIITQMYMLAGNSGGYFLPYEGKTDLKRYARLFRIDDTELKQIIDDATETGLIDRDKFKKYNIITNHSLQWSFLMAKRESKTFSMDWQHVLDSVYEFAKSDGKYKKIAEILDELADKFNSKVQDGKELKSKELDGKSPTVVDDTDLTLTQFKLKYPNKCKGLPDGWKVPAGVSLKTIADAIENSQKFLAIAKHMNLQKMANPEFYEKICNGEYDDDKFKKMNEAKKETGGLTESLTNVQKSLQEVYGNAN